MMKCDMCIDRTAEGLKPMCASVCPSDALWYGTREEFASTRRGELIRDFTFGAQDVGLWSTRSSTTWRRARWTPWASR